MIGGCRRRAVSRIFAFAVALLFPLAVQAEDDLQALVRLKREIAQVVGDGRCANAVQCRVVAMGYDRCGNPSTWVAFNYLPGIKEVVETKGQEYTFIEEEMQRGNPRPQDCPPMRKASPACINGRCAAGDTSY
ncbi:MAG: hypothetical protein U1F52_04975 [Burkholderiales bacterium]